MRASGAAHFLGGLMYLRTTFASTLLLLAAHTCLFGQNVTTQRNDNSRTGVNAAETTLTVSNVNATSFGKLFSLPVDGQVYVQPLYLANVTIPSQGVHNVVYVATEHNSVYAFDADNPNQTAPLWKTNLGTSMLCSNISFCTSDIIPEIGITSTPVIDPVNMTIYVVAEVAATPTTPKFTLHALDATTGAEKFNGPATITATVAGSGVDSVNGKLTFNPLYHLQRPALLLLNGTVFVTFGSHQDYQTWHGWIFGYDEKSLRQVAVRCLSPDGSYGGVGLWQGGIGPAADANGNIYLVTGNGDLNAATGGQSYGQSVVKLSSKGLTVLDYFAPGNWSYTNSSDLDLGSGGPMLIPGTSLIIAGGKDGIVYVVNTANMGGYNTVADQMVQKWSAACCQLFGGRIFYNSTLFIWSTGDYLKSYSYTGGATPFNTTAKRSSVYVADGYKNTPAVSLSANGTTAGTAILWAAYSQSGSANGGDFPGYFQAFDASTLNEIWGSEMNPSRDYSGSWSKWAPPTVVNGKVYLATFDNLVNVYGLLGH